VSPASHCLSWGNPLLFSSPSPFFRDNSPFPKPTILPQFPDGGRTSYPFPSKIEEAFLPSRRPPRHQFLPLSNLNSSLLVATKNTFPRKSRFPSPLSPQQSRPLPFRNPFFLPPSRDVNKPLLYQHANMDLPSSNLPEIFPIPGSFSRPSPFDATQEVLRGIAASHLSPPIPPLNLHSANRLFPVFSSLRKVY